MKHVKHITIILFAIVLGACTATGKYTTSVPESNDLIKADKAAIVFMRASSYGGAITSPLLEVDEQGNTSMVGIIGPDEKMVKYVEPGERMFMVIGENADFMKANVEAGKVYYAIIRPRMGIWKARFSVTPFKLQPENDNFNLQGENLIEWLAECKMTEPNQAAFAWHTQKVEDLRKLYLEYYPDWKAKDVAKRDAATLATIDGVTTPIK